MRAIVIGMACFAMTACDSPNFRTHQFRFGDSDTLAATGSLRLVTERRREFSDGSARTIMCSEPSPDYAAAFDQDATATVKSAVANAPISEGTFGLHTVETIQKGDGRSKGVLALRDGLYAACQAYVNGLIGKDAYSIILSQYGLLLVALMQDDGAGSAAPVAGAAPGAAGAGAAGAGGAAAAGAKVAAVAARKAQAASAFAAVLVACINGSDPTRGTDAGPPGNPLLDRGYCRSVLIRARDKT